MRWATLDCSRPRIVGILNVTPDSFYDGGKSRTVAMACRRAADWIEQGADFIEIGGESTRPGAQPVSLEEERGRVIPVVKALASHGAPLIVDTSQPGLMAEAIDGGVVAINDVRALERPGACEIVARSRVAVCLMHMQGTPATMQVAPSYGEVVAEVRSALIGFVERARAAGIGNDQIALDPGFGFGKTPIHNLTLLRQLRVFSGLGFPLMVGLSRKSLIGYLTGRPLEERLAGSVAAALMALEAGARLLRVHDVAETRDAIRIWEAIHDDEPSAAA
jgi:dihydropteroate synthase